MKLYVVHPRYFAIESKKLPENSYHKISQSRERVVEDFPETGFLAAFKTQDEARRYVYERERKYYDDDYYYYGTRVFYFKERPILLVEVPDWVVITERYRNTTLFGSLEADDPIISASLVRKIISVELDKEELLPKIYSQLSPLPKNNWKDIAYGILFSTTLVILLLATSVISQWSVVLLTGGGSFLLTLLIKKGLTYFLKSSSNKELSDEKSSQQKEVKDPSLSPKLQTELVYSVEQKSSPKIESKRAEPSRIDKSLQLKTDIQKLLGQYDQQKGYCRRLLGDQKDVTKLRGVVESSREGDSQDFTLQEIFGLSKAVAEESTEDGHASSQVFDELRIKMEVSYLSNSEQYSPLEMGRFLRFMGLFDQRNFERLCACSLNQQKIICTIMQNLYPEEREQIIFDIIYENVSILSFIDGKDSDWINLTVKSFYSILNLIPYYMSSPPNIKLICQLSSRGIIQLDKIIKKLPSSLITRQNIEALCEGLKIEKKMNEDEFLYFSIKTVPAEFITQENFMALCLRRGIGGVLVSIPIEMHTPEMFNTLLAMDDDMLALLYQGLAYYHGNITDKEELHKSLKSIAVTVYYWERINVEPHHPHYPPDSSEFRDYLNLLLDHIRSEGHSSQLLAFCQGMHPRLGADSQICRFFGEGKAVPLDPMAKELGEIKLVGMIKSIFS